MPQAKRYCVPFSFILCGFILGVFTNYYGFLFETIRVQVIVALDESANTTTLRQWNVLPPRTDNATLDYVVPNIVHYIWFAKNNHQQMSFLNYISFLSAYKIQKPSVIMLHCNYLPAGEWWDRVWREIPINITYREPPTTVHDQTLVHMYHRGDIAKMEILMEYGGIYLDYDVIVVNSLDPVRKFDATLGKEKPPKFIAGIIVAKRKALFLQLLYESYRNNYRALDWDYNCARVAYEIYLQRPDLLHVEPYKFTTPDWKDRRLLWNEVIDWHDLYVIHVMGHFNFVEYTPEYIKGLNSTFGEAMRYIYYGSWKIIE